MTPTQRDAILRLLDAVEAFENAKSKVGRAHYPETKHELAKMHEAALYVAEKAVSATWICSNILPVRPL